MMTEAEVLYDASQVRYDVGPLGTGKNWVTKADPIDGLGPFIRAIAHALIRHGHDESSAISIAVGAVQKWASGGGHVTPKTRAKAAEALAHWEEIKGKAHIQSSIGGGKRDGGFGGSFVGETGASGAGLFLPAGPSEAQDEAIQAKETAKPHRFVGNNLSHCDTCGLPVMAAVHRTQGEPTKGPGQPIPPVPRQATLIRTEEQIDGKLTTEPHRFVGKDITSCDECAAHIKAPQHRMGRKSRPDPIASTLAELRHAGPDHAPVVTGHIKGVPARHKAAAYAANHKNYAVVEEPLADALRAHFGEQRQATVNRLLGKRGGRMLKRAAEEFRARPPVPPLGEGYEEATPAPLPDNPHDLGVTTEEPNTTSPIDQTSLSGALSDEQQAAAVVAAEHAGPESVITPADAEAAGQVAAPQVALSISPQEIFDSSFWATKLAGVLGPHLNTAAALAQGAVKTQLSVPSTTDDASSIGAVQAILKQRASDIANSVTGTTADKLAAALQQGVANGEGRDAIAARVNAVFDNADSVRAKLISQNAVVGSYNEAASTYASNLPKGLLGSRTWLSHRDARTRPSHRLANGQEQPMGQPFYVGGSPMMFPGDVAAPPSEWMGCRCSVSYNPPGMTHAPMAAAAQAYVNALHATPPKPVSPYLIPA